ncbi:unnamed protein product, partial [Symbiodinium sp. CCMP2456]
MASGGVGCYSVSELCALTGGGRLPGHLPVACCPTCVIGGPGLHALPFLFGLSLAFSDCPRPGGGPGSGCRPSTGLPPSVYFTHLALAGPLPSLSRSAHWHLPGLTPAALLPGRVAALAT